MSSSGLVSVRLLKTNCSWIQNIRRLGHLGLCVWCVLCGGGVCTVYVVCAWDVCGVHGVCLVCVCVYVLSIWVFQFSLSLAAPLIFYDLASQVT